MATYCSFIDGKCEFGSDALKCKTRSTVYCRTLRQKLEGEKMRTEACNKIHDVAKHELGVHETPGPAATARIVEYAKHTTLKATSDEIPWCSSFANFAVDSAGFEGTHSAAARSWLQWGVKLDAPILGCIVVLDRHDDSNPTAAHVTICDHPDISNGIIRCIGGNQSDAVKVSRFPVEKVLGYRAPV